jgi:hypothetical protein
MVRLLFLAMCALPSLFAGLINVDLARTIDYAQTSGTSTTYQQVFFTARAFTDNPFDFLGAELSTPASSGIPMILDGTTWSHTPTPFNANGDPTLDLSDMAGSFPTGLYRFNMINLTPVLVELDYLQDYFPVAYQAPLLDDPVFADLSAGIAGNQDFTFSWNTFDADPSADENFVFFRVRNASNVIVFDSGPLSATTTGITVAAGTFLEFATYTWDLFFSGRINGIDPNSSIPWTQQFNTHTYAEFTTGVNAVPEPATWAAGAAALLLFYVRRRSA